MDNKSFINELQQDIKKDRKYKIFKKHAAKIITLFSLLIISFFSYTSYVAYQNNASKEASKEFFTSLKFLYDESYDDALASFTKIWQNSSDGYKELSAFNIVAICIKKGEYKEAQAHLTHIISAKNISEPMVDIARILLLKLLLFTNQTNQKSLVSDQILSKIEYFTLNKSSNLYYNALYIKAEYSILLDDMDDAILSLQEIINNSLGRNSNITQKSQLLLASLEHHRNMLDTETVE